MKLYKYRAIDPSDTKASQRIERIVGHKLIWCARPDTLNDPAEFAWTCDFNPSPKTADVLAGLLAEAKGYSPDVASLRADIALRSGEFEVIGTSVVSEMTQAMRRELGLACFGATPDNPTLWSRYAGNGTGICIELEVPEWVVKSQMHRVVYQDQRLIHIDDFILSRSHRPSADLVFAVLSTKTTFWESEQEIRFVSKHPDVEVLVDGAAVSSIFLGPSCPPAVEGLVATMSSIPRVKL